KSASARLALVGQPHLVATAPDGEPPPPPAHLGTEAQAMWRRIVRENPGMNCAGHILLECAIAAFTRADECAEIIERDGGPLAFGWGGVARRHPLTSVEIRNRKVVSDIFKRLRFPC